MAEDPNNKYASHIVAAVKAKIVAEELRRLGHPSLAEFFEEVREHLLQLAASLR